MWPWSTIVAANPRYVAEFSWAGGYIGIRGGYAQSDAGWQFAATLGVSTDHDGSGGFIGGRIGYNFKLSGATLLGVEAEGNVADVDGSTACPNPTFACGHKIDRFGSVNGRLAHAAHGMLFNINGGVAFANVDYSATFIPTGVEFGTGFNETLVGWTISTGVEVMMAKSLVLDIGYKYYDFGSDTAPAGALGGGTTRVSSNIHTIHMGLAFRF
jgi:outer membrane immunogenic protein